MNNGNETSVKLAAEDILVRMVPTPNPHAQKFVINSSLKDEGKATFNSTLECEGLPLVRDVFAISGVAQVHLFQNTMTVTHGGQISDDELEAQVAAVLKTRYPIHDPKFGETNPAKVRPQHTDPVLVSIEEILDRTIRPGLQSDGGDIEVVGLQGDELQILYQGACGTCPSSLMGTLDAIQGILRAELGNENLTVAPV